MSHGSLTWRDWRWELGPRFVRYDDPTNTLGSGDDDGQPVAPAARRCRQRDPGAADLPAGVQMGWR
jgi:hypothetical protein